MDIQRFLVACQLDRMPYSPLHKRRSNKAFNQVLSHPRQRIEKIVKFATHKKLVRRLVSSKRFHAPGALMSTKESTHAYKDFNSLSVNFFIDKFLQGLCSWNPCAAATHQQLRKCEYDEDTNEYWVNIRTEGVLSREDIEELSRKRSHEQDTAVGDDFFSGMPDGFDELNGGFSGGLGGAPLEQELGDGTVCVTWLWNQNRIVQTAHCFI